MTACREEDLIKDNLKKLTESIEKLVEANKRLVKENEYLKDENCKDEELKKMREKLSVAYRSLSRGFPITEEEDEKIRNWVDEHSMTHMNNCTGRRKYPGCGYSYKFTPTSLGVYGEILCTCGASFCFKELE